MDSVKTAMDKASDKVVKKGLVPTRIVMLLVLFAVALGVRSYQLDENPRDFWTVRQYRGALLARAFFFHDNESIPEWRRVVAEANRPAIREPPILEWLAATGYRLIGRECFGIPRVITVLAVGWGLSLCHRQTLDDVCFVAVEKLIGRADGVINTSSFLQSKFGGWIVPMGVDTSEYNPRPEIETQERKAGLGLGDDRVIVFGGVVRPHKGVELILDALALLGNALLVVGPETEHLRVLTGTGRYRSYLRYAGVKKRGDAGVSELGGFDCHPPVGYAVGAVPGSVQGV